MTFLFYWSVFTLLGGFTHFKKICTFKYQGEFSMWVLLISAFFLSIPITIIHLFITSFWR